MYIYANVSIPVRHTKQSLCNAAQVRPSPLVQIETTPQHCRADDVRKQHAAWLVYNDICTVNSEFRISIGELQSFYPTDPSNVL